MYRGEWNNQFNEWWWKQITWSEYQWSAHVDFPFARKVKGSDSSLAHSHFWDNGFRSISLEWVYISFHTILSRQHEPASHLNFWWFLKFINAWSWHRLVLTQTWNMMSWSLQSHTQLAMTLHNSELACAMMPDELFYSLITISAGHGLGSLKVLDFHRIFHKSGHFHLYVRQALLL